MMVERANVKFHICAISHFSFSDKVAYLYFSFNIATALLCNFVNQQILNKVQKALYSLQEFQRFKKFFS